MRTAGLDTDIQNPALTMPAAVRRLFLDAFHEHGAAVVIQTPTQLTRRPEPQRLASGAGTSPGARACASGLSQGHRGLDIARIVKIHAAGPNASRRPASWVELEAYGHLMDGFLPLTIVVI